MDARYSIILARPQDVVALPTIERAAANLLAGHVPASMLDETTDLAEFRQAQAAGQLWVALDRDLPVGFALVRLIGDWAHLQELDVDPNHGRRGLGAAMVNAVCAWAARSGYSELTLTTFRHLPWNLPFYVRQGFEVVPLEEAPAELVAIVLDEAARGLDPERRAIMRYSVSE